MRWAGLIAWLPLCLNNSTYPREGEFRVTAFDVRAGHGVVNRDCASSHALRYRSCFIHPLSDAGSRVIYPYLKMRGISQLDALMISHTSDTDHSGRRNLKLLQQLQFDRVRSSLKPESPVVQMAEQLSHHSVCLAGQQWQWDGVHLIRGVASDGIDVRKRKMETECAILYAENQPGESLDFIGR